MIGNRHVAAVEQLAQGIRVTRSSVLWFGETIRGKRSVPGDQWDSPSRSVDAHLQQILYNSFYTVGRPMLKAELVALMRATSFDDSMESMHSANPGLGRQEEGWLYLRASGESGALVVTKNGLAVSVGPKDLPACPDAGSLAFGADLVIRRPSGSMNASPGFYVAHSDADLDYTQAFSRCYLNVAPNRAREMLHELCVTLNGAHEAFDLKIASQRSVHHRADVAVLYLPRMRVRNTVPLVAGVVSKNRNAMRPQVPALVHALMPGVGLADNPEGDVSFGIHRCRLLAEGFVSAKGSRNAVERFAAIRLAFESKGLSLEKPYLNAESADIYVDL